MIVRPENALRSWVDRLLFALFTRGWRATDIDAYPEKIRQQYAISASEALNSFELIDGKATGLLTHVSLMIAGLGLVAPLVANSDVELGIVIAEIAIYLLIAVGCLRCLSVARARDFADEAHLKDFIRHELIIRRELYSLCIRVSIGFTAVVFLLLPLLYFWKPVR